MNIRSRWSGICTGDQGIFVRRDLLELIDGVPDQPLMEDIELTKRLRRYANPICVDVPLGVSARRWQQRGIASTILLMWRLRLQYFFGTSAGSARQGVLRRALVDRSSRCSRACRRSGASKRASRVSSASVRRSSCNGCCWNGRSVR